MARAWLMASPALTGGTSAASGKIGDADEGGPMLTTGMGAALQGFPEDWSFHGGKTSRWRQIGNAFPPPAARAVGTSVRAALGAR